MQEVLDQIPVSSSSNSEQGENENGNDRDNYLNGSIDKIEEIVNESGENYDINPDHYEYGESTRYTSEKQIATNLGKKVTTDRQTPEFKLNNNEELLLKDQSNIELGEKGQMILKGDSNKKRRIINKINESGDN